MIVYNDSVFIQCKSREEVSKLLLLYPDANIANPKNTQEFEEVKRRYQKQYKSKNKTIYKDISKTGLRYIVVSYAILMQNNLCITFDTSRVSSTLRLGGPVNVDARVAYHGTNTSIQMLYNFDSDSLITMCQAILTCIKLSPALYPLEVRVEKPDIAGIIRSYTGKSWVINELKRYLSQPGIWLSYEEDL